MCSSVLTAFVMAFVPKWKRTISGCFLAIGFTWSTKSFIVCIFWCCVSWKALFLESVDNGVPNKKIFCCWYYHLHFFLLHCFAFLQHYNFGDHWQLFHTALNFLPVFAPFVTINWSQYCALKERKEFDSQISQDTISFLFQKKAINVTQKGNQVYLRHSLANLRYT